MKHMSIKSNNAENDFDVIILGAGITGLVSASALARKGYEKILILEEYDHIGGNHIDAAINGYTFDIGSLIFQDDSPLLRHFGELLPHYVPITPAWARLNPQGKITRYPISIRDDIVSGGPLVLGRILFSALWARLFRRRMRNAEDFASYWIGPYLLNRTGLKSYMQRFYGADPSKIDLELAKKRMLWISEHASVGNLMRKAFSSLTPSPPGNRQLARPREGFAALYRCIEDKLRGLGVSFSLGTRISAIEKTGEVFYVRTSGRSFTAKTVVSTIPVSRAAALCGLTEGKTLQTITLITLYFSFSGNRGFEESILYNFSHGGSWKRLTVYSDFYGKVRGREYFAAEVVANHLDGGVEAAEQDFRSHVSNAGLFQGDLVLEGSHVLENAYPIYNHGAQQEADRAIAALESFGILSHGKQGAFNYQPTARTSTDEAETALAALAPAHAAEKTG